MSQVLPLDRDATDVICSWFRSVPDVETFKANRARRKLSVPLGWRCALGDDL